VREARGGGHRRTVFGVVERRMKPV